MRRTPIHRASRLFALAIVLLLPAQVPAQSLDSLDSGNETERLIDPRPALEAARTSFETAAAARREEVVRGRELSEPVRERLGKIVDEEERRFAEAADRTITELRGDGILTADEISRELGKLRSDRLAALTERLEAAIVGTDAPPSAEDSTPVGRYVGRLLQYTLVERNPPIRWLELLAFIAAGLLLAWLISFSLDLVAGRLRRSRTRRTFEALTSTLKGPLYLATALVGIAAGLRRIWIPVVADEVVWTILRLLFAGAGYWLAWNLCAALTSTVARAVRRTRASINDQAVDVARKGLRLFVSVVFVLFVTEVVFRSDIRGLLAGIGIAGIALSLAAQDTLKNIIASFTLFGDRPFVLGDLVRYGEHFGKVEQIGFRSTRIRRFDGHVVTVPNAKMISEEIENVSARPYIRRRFRIDLPYGTPVEKVREAKTILHDILDGRDCWPDDFDPKVEFVEFGPYSLRLLVEYRQQPPDYWGAFARDTEINTEILERFREAGIEFAFPTRQVVLEHAFDQDSDEESGGDS